MKWRYNVNKTDSYEEKTLLRLLLLILRHRYWHWKRGEGFID